MSNLTQSRSEMYDAAQMRAITADVFAVTGKKMDEDDPIVVAAFFQAHIMRQATREAAGQIAEAGKAVKVAVDDACKVVADATALARQTAADQKAYVNAVDICLRKAIREAGRVESSQVSPPRGWRGVLAGVVLGVFVAAGLLSIACDFSFSWVHDASVGRAYMRAIPTLEPSLRQKLLKHVEKQLK